MKPAWITLSGMGLAAAAITSMALAPQFYLPNIIGSLAGVVIGAIGIVLWLDDKSNLSNRRCSMTDPIEEQRCRSMYYLAHTLDMHFNGPRLPGVPPRIGFILLTDETGKIDNHRVNYISNREREDMIAMLRAHLARLEGRVTNAPKTRQ